MSWGVAVLRGHPLTGTVGTASGPKLRERLKDDTRSLPVGDETRLLATPATRTRWEQD
jgi:hypothetical protein